MAKVRGAGNQMDAFKNQRRNNVLVSAEMEGIRCPSTRLCEPKNDLPMLIKIRKSYNVQYHL